MSKRSEREYLFKTHLPHNPGIKTACGSPRAAAHTAAVVETASSAVGMDLSGDTLKSSGENLNALRATLGAEKKSAS